MQKTRREAIDEFLGFVGELGDADARNVAERLLSRAVEAIWQKHPWRDFQSPFPIELPLVVHQRSYPLPEYFGRLGYGTVRNLTRGGAPIYPLDSSRAQEAFPGAGTTREVGGSPCYYEIGGTVGVQRQPLVTGEALEIFFDDAADINIRVSLEGADADGNERRVQVSSVGLTAVSVGTWSYVDSVGKSYPLGTTPTTAYTSSVSTMTLRKTGDQTILQRLFPEESAREHRIITFYPKPAVADVVAIPVLRRPKRLLFDADPLPNDWWNAIFEEMHIAWRVNTGELPVDSVVPRPHLIDLQMTDNANRPARSIRPFGVLGR